MYHECGKWNVCPSTKANAKFKKARHSRLDWQIMASASVLWWFIFNFVHPFLLGVKGILIPCFLVLRERERESKGVSISAPNSFMRAIIYSSICKWTQLLMSSACRLCHQNTSSSTWLRTCPKWMWMRANSRKRTSSRTWLGEPLSISIAKTKKLFWIILKFIYFRSRIGSVCKCVRSEVACFPTTRWERLRIHAHCRYLYARVIQNENTKNKRMLAYALMLFLNWISKNMSELFYDNNLTSRNTYISKNINLIIKNIFNYIIKVVHLLQRRRQERAVAVQTSHASDRKSAARGRKRRDCGG